MATKTKTETKVLPAETNVEKRSRTISEGVKESWKNKTIAAKRKRRFTAYVTKPGSKTETAFSSVRKAFTAYKLPDSRHIKFRGSVVGNLDSGDGKGLVIDGYRIRVTENLG